METYEDNRGHISGVGGGGGGHGAPPGSGPSLRHRGAQTPVCTTGRLRLSAEQVSTGFSLL